MKFLEFLQYFLNSSEFSSGFAKFLEFLRSSLNFCNFLSNPSILPEFLRSFLNFCNVFWTKANRRTSTMLLGLLRGFLKHNKVQTYLKFSEHPEVNIVRFPARNSLNWFKIPCTPLNLCEMIWTIATFLYLLQITRGSCKASWTPTKLQSSENFLESLRS